MTGYPVVFAVVKVCPKDTVNGGALSGRGRRAVYQFLCVQQVRGIVSVYFRLEGFIGDSAGAVCVCGDIDVCDGYASTD